MGEREKREQKKKNVLIDSNFGNEHPPRVGLTEAN
jgi:hypothetical protein